MQRFLLKAALHAVVTICALVLAYIAYGRRFPLKENYYAAADDKEQLLATSAPPRLIVVGGSSVAFGIDAELIGTRLGLTPVNMGLQVGFGLSFMLSQIEDRVRAGDVVVLAPEYNAFVQYFLADPEMLGFVIERNPAFLSHLPPGEIKKLLDRGMVMRVGNIMRGACGGPPRGLELSDPIYHRRAFNEHGDLVSYLGAKERGPMRIRFKYQPNTAEPAIRRLNSFHEKCRERGAQVFFTHPPLHRDSFNHCSNAVAVLEAELRQQLTIPMLDRPADNVFDGDIFFDTAYHLNPRGRTLHSEQLAQRLLARRSNKTAATSLPP